MNEHEDKPVLQAAFLGNGKGANRYHIPYLLQRPDKFHIKTIYSRSGKSDWPALEGVNYTQDLEEVLQDPDIDVVIIASPVQSHFELAKKALEAGKNVVMEKPFTSTALQAKELFDLARKNEVMLQAYQNRRFDSEYLTALEVLDSGILGNLIEIEFNHDYYRAEEAKKAGAFVKENSLLYGYGPHMIDQVLARFGKPDRVEYDLRQLMGDDKANDLFDIDLYYGPLKVSVRSSFFRLQQRPAVIVTGKNGIFTKQNTDNQEKDLKRFYMPGQPGFGMDQPEEYGILHYVSDEGEVIEQPVETITGDYGRYYDALYESLVHGKEPLVLPEETLLNMEILEEGIARLSQKQNAK